MVGIIIPVCWAVFGELFVCVVGVNLLLELLLLCCFVDWFSGSSLWSSVDFCCSVQQERDT